jgi:alpha-L-arabinofuranosidase
MRRSISVDPQPARLRGRRGILAVLVIPVAMFVAGTSLSAAAPNPGVPHTASLVGHWAFDESAGTTAADSSGHNHPLTLLAGAGFGTGVVGPHALVVDGTRQQSAVSSGPVIDTGRSFTVSAWVNLSNTNGYQTFVSEDGTQVSAFFLQLRGDSHRFAFTRLSYDSPSAYGTIATSPIIPQPGVWYHLAGVFDASAQTVSLYVNGTLQQTIDYPASWAATGPLAVGRGFYNGGRVDWVSGSIDDVRAYSGVLSADDIHALAGAGSITVHTGQPGPAINSTQFGAFLEEINHSGDAGVYAQLVRNWDLKESASAPAYWSAVQDGTAHASIGLDTTQPLDSANPVALKLSVAAVPAGGRVGVANGGYWGIPVTASTTYQLSFYAKASGYTGPLTATLETNGGRILASARTASLGGAWTKYTATLTTPARLTPSLTNRLVLATSDPAATNATIWFDIVSLFPPTFDNTSNGLRVDIMRKIAAMHPGYFRVPGGNYLEGDTLDTRFQWKTTIGPIENRPGHDNSAWGYWSTDGMGLLEYLEMAEEVGAQPILAVNAGYALNGTVAPTADWPAYVQDALDEIQYVTGPTSTPWGARRAADGHPSPFALSYVEIGNEDFFDSSGSYNQRFAAFFDAIRAAYPQLKLIATTSVTSRTPDVIDDHDYRGDPTTMAGDAHEYDNAARTGPKRLVGEFAVTQGSPTGTLGDALGEAAFMTGLERNADLVIGSSYAPLLVNVNATNWSTNLIGYNGLSSYGSPSYYVQRMFGTSVGDHVAPAQIVGGNGGLFAVASSGADGRVYLTVVNIATTDSAVTLSVTGIRGVSGGTATVLTGDPVTMNSLAHPTAVAPATTALGRLDPTFRHTFPASSVTVLALNAID